MSYYGPTGIQGVTGMTGPQGYQGPMVIFGPTGQQGATGPTGVYSTYGLTGQTGTAGAAAPVSSNPIQLTLQSYTGMALANAVSFSNATPTTIWTKAVPAQAQGKSCMVNLYIDITYATGFPINTSFDFGVYVDGVGQGFGSTKTVRYIQAASNTVAMGTNIMTPLRPITIPITFSASAGNITIGLLNSSIAIPTTAVIGVDARISTV